MAAGVLEFVGMLDGSERRELEGEECWFDGTVEKFCEGCKETESDVERGEKRKVDDV